MPEQVMAQPQQESVDPAIQQISEFISQAINQGQNPAEVVMSLVQQQVDQQVIGQALMMNGFEENDIMSLFQEMSQGQQPEEQVGGEPFSSANLNQTPEQLTEDTSMHSDEMSAEETDEPGLSMGKSGIEIKPENEGKFTRWAQARGMSVQEAASKVMSNTDEYPPAVVKMANFAKNAAGWNKEYGGATMAQWGLETSSKNKKSLNIKPVVSETKKDSVAHQANKILQYEQLRGGPGGSPLPYYGDPQYMNTLMNTIYPEIQKIMPNASAMETGEAMDFVFNAGWDKVNNKIEKDPRGFALQEYYKKYDPSKLDADGKWTGRKNAPYSFDKEYAATIGKLSENERRVLMNKGRDWYYQNTAPKGSTWDLKTQGPHPNYEDTWYGRIWNTNDYNPFNPKNPKFTKKQLGGDSQGKVSTVNNVPVDNDMNWQRAPLYMNPMAFEYSNDNFSLGKAAAVAYGGYKEFLSGADANKDGVKDGFFRDASKKAGIRDATKGDYYNYKITQDANDPNKYMADNTDLYNASRNKGSLRTVDQYGKDVAANSRFNYDTDTHDYNFITSSRPIDERIYDSAAQKNAIAGKDYNYLNAMDKDTMDMIMGGKDDPSGVRMGIDEFGSGMSYLPGSKNPYEYNTYMGINKVGQSSMIPTGNNGQPVAAMTASPASPAIQGIPDFMRQQTDYKADTQAISNSQLQKRFSGLGATPEQQTQSMFGQQSKYDALRNLRFRYGGDLDKAQVGPPNWLAGMVNQNNYYDQSQQEGINDFFTNMGQTNYAQDTQAVANAQLQNAQSTLGATPQQQQTQSMFTPQQGAPTLIDPNASTAASRKLYNDQQALGAAGQNTILLTDDQVANKPAYGEPKVQRTNKFEGGLNRFMDSPGIQGYGKLSNFAVQGAGVINDWFADKNINQAKEDNFNKLGADYQYATAEDPFNKRGMWDVNTGTAGSEGDRTTGLYISKYGGENNTVDVDSNLLAKLIAAGADIEIL